MTASDGGPGGNRTHIRGFAVRCITILPPDPTWCVGYIHALAVLVKPLCAGSLLGRWCAGT